MIGNETVYINIKILNTKRLPGPSVNKYYNSPKFSQILKNCNKLSSEPGRRFVFKVLIFI